MGHAAMINSQTAPAVGGPNDLDALLYPPPALPYQPGRVREYTLVATDREVEIAPGVFFPAWTYNGTIPRTGDSGDRGRHPPRPVRRTRESIPTRFISTGSTRRTCDGAFEIVYRGEEFTYEFPARPGPGSTSITATRRR